MTDSEQTRSNDTSENGTRPGSAVAGVMQYEAKWEQSPQRDDGLYKGWFWVWVDQEDISIFRPVRVTPPEHREYAQVHCDGQTAPLPEWQKLHALWLGPIPEPEKPSTA